MGVNHESVCTCAKFDQLVVESMSRCLLQIALVESGEKHGKDEAQSRPVVANTFFILR